ncbi:MAG: glycosyltransferase, partial [Dehalobacter sp. 4CP]|nr:glycosyltransferase [Dehalobacter sp. 4CP]
MDFSVIVPVYREEDRINGLAGHVLELARRDSAAVEIVVADGGPGSTTLAAIRVPGVIPVKSGPGRGVQMNAGAAASSGRILLFLHADTVLPEKAFSLAESLLEDGHLAGGAFDLALDDPAPVFRLIGRVASLRSRLARIPYGDQAIFVMADLFRSLGGYREFPLFEDVDLMWRLKRGNFAIGFVDRPVVTSARRWKKEGVVRAT